MTTCTYCGSTDWESRDGAVACQQCGLTPAEALAEDARHRESAGGVDASKLRETEQCRRAAKVVEAGEGMPMQERLRAAKRLLLECAALPSEHWDQQFAAWRREASARLRAAERRAV